MHAFFDDSKTVRLPGFLMFGGYIASDDRLNALALDWSNLLHENNLPFLHTSDFLAGKGDYKGLAIEQDRAKREKIVRQFADVVSRRAEIIILVGVETSAFATVPKTVKGRLSPQAFCLLRLLHNCHLFLPQAEFPSPLTICFDDSHDDSPAIYGAWSRLKRAQKFDKKMVASICFAEDQVIYPQQAADVIACGVTRELAKGEEMWGPDSPFYPLIQTGNGRARVVQEYWDDELFAQQFESAFATVPPVKIASS